MTITTPKITHYPHTHNNQKENQVDESNFFSSLYTIKHELSEMTKRHE